MQKKYVSAAEKQRAYRNRLKENRWAVGRINATGQGHTIILRDLNETQAKRLKQQLEFIYPNDNFMMADNAHMHEYDN